MKETINVEKRRVKDCSHGVMGQLIMVNFAIIISMDLANTSGRINVNIKVIGNIIKCTVRENLHGLMERNILVFNENI